MGQRKDSHRCSYCDYITKDCSNFRRHVQKHLAMGHEIKTGKATNEDSEAAATEDYSKDITNWEKNPNQSNFEFFPDQTLIEFPNSPRKTKKRQKSHRSHYERSYRRSFNEPFQMWGHGQSRFWSSKSRRPELFNESHIVVPTSSLESTVFQTVLDRMEALEERIEYLEYQNDFRYS